MPDDHTSKEQSTALARLRADYSWPRSRPTAAPQMNHGWLDPSTQGFLKAALTRDVRLVVELGSWLGLSTRFLAEHAPQATVIAIDHWRGSPEHHSNPEWAAMLERLFDTFLASCCVSGGLERGHYGGGGWGGSAVVGGGEVAYQRHVARR